MKEYKISTVIPIYSQRLWLVATDSIYKSQLDIPVFSDKDFVEPGNAVTMLRETAMGIFLKHTHLTHRHITHEAFHATMWLAHDIGAKFDPENDECYAYLHDWICGWIYSKLDKWGLDVSCSMFIDPTKIKKNT